MAPATAINVAADEGLPSASALSVVSIVDAAQVDTICVLGTPTLVQFVKAGLLTRFCDSSHSLIARLKLNANC